MNKNLICPLCKIPIELKEDKYICPHCNAFYPIRDGIYCFVKEDYKGSGFSQEMFKSLFEIEKKHFWHTGRKEIIYQILKQSIKEKIKNLKMIEIGCGNGIVLQYLKEKGINTEGADISIEGLNFCKKRVNVPFYQIDALSTPFPTESYDLVGMFDLIEHIEDDQLLLREASRICKKNGKIIITVPANNYLWSYFDVISGHQRRYSKKELVLKLEKAGFKIERISFYIFFLFPIFLIFRKLAVFKNHNKKLKISKLLELKIIPLINNIFLMLLRIEKKLLLNFNLPLGTSLICIAKK